MPRSSELPSWRPTDEAIERPADCIILSAMLGLAASRARRASSRSSSRWRCASSRSASRCCRAASFSAAARWRAASLSAIACWRAASAAAFSRLGLGLGRGGGGGGLVALGLQDLLGAVAVEQRVIFGADRVGLDQDRPLLRGQRPDPRARRLDQRPLDRRRRAVGQQQRHQRLADLELGDRGGDVDLGIGPEGLGRRLDRLLVARA